MLTPYPWQIRQWEQLTLAAGRERLTHALLLSGLAGSGIRQFALGFARYLLCEAPGEAAACGQCRSCILFDAGNHPDLRLLEPEADSAQIKVEAVRELIAYLQLSKHDKRKIAVIAPAEGMNWRSTNNLLKTLEEPAPATLLILVCHQPARLPATIRSRCQTVSFYRIDRQIACEWLNERLGEPARTAELLELAAGAPLKALETAETDAAQCVAEILADLRAAGLAQADPVKIAGKWQKYDVADVFNWLLFVFSRMSMTRAPGATKTEGSTDQSSIDGRLSRLGEGLDLRQLLDCYDLALHNHHLLTGETNVNKQGLMEEIIVRWQAHAGASGRLKKDGRA